MKYILTTDEHIKRFEQAIRDNCAVDQVREYCLTLEVPEDIVLDIIKRIGGADEAAKRKAEMVQKWFGS